MQNLGVGKFTDIATSLYSVRRSFVPKAPLDTVSDWFNYKDATDELPAESMILEDRYTRSLGRIVVFSTSGQLGI